MRILGLRSALNQAALGGRDEGHVLPVQEHVGPDTVLQVDANAEHDPARLAGGDVQDAAKVGHRRGALNAVFWTNR